MKPRKPPADQDDLLRARLVELIDMRHELVKLATLIDWDIFEREWVGFFPSHTCGARRRRRVLWQVCSTSSIPSRSRTRRLWLGGPRISIGSISAARRFFQHRCLPIDPSSMTRWRKRICEEGVEWLLTQMIEAGKRAGAARGNDLKRVMVDTTVMEKNIVHLTDARLSSHT